MERNIARNETRFCHWWRCRFSRVSGLLLTWSCVLHHSSALLTSSSQMLHVTSIYSLTFPPVIRNWNLSTVEWRCSWNSTFSIKTFVTTHFNNIVSKFRNWFRITVMNENTWMASRPASPTRLLLRRSPSPSFQLSCLLFSDVDFFCILWKENLLLWCRLVYASALMTVSCNAYYVMVCYVI